MIIRAGKKIALFVGCFKAIFELPASFVTLFEPDNIVYTDNFASYDVLDVSDFKHYRINHSTQFVDKKDRQNHINGIENFWNQAKRHMRKFNGIPKAHFELYLKECEWRFNTPSAKQQLTMLKQIVKGKI